MKDLCMECSNLKINELNSPKKSPAACKVEVACQTTKCLSSKLYNFFISIFV